MPFALLGVDTSTSDALLKRLRRLILSCLLAVAATAGFVAAVGASKDGLVLLLFGGFWIGIHAFLGFVRLSRRLDRVARLNLLSSSEYERLTHRQDEGWPPNDD